MGGPYESCGNGGVSFIVDSQAAMIDKPSPCTFDDPSLWEHLESVGNDTVHDLSNDPVSGTAMASELPLESSVSPYLREPTRLRCRPVHDCDPADVVGHIGRDHYHRDQQAEGVNDTECLASRDPLARIETPRGTGHGRGALDAASVDDTPRCINITAFPFAYQGAEPVADRFPGAVARPGDVVAVDGVPVRIALGKCPPLAAGRGDIEDRVQNVSAVVLYWPSHPTSLGPWFDEVSDESPLLVGHVAVGGPPCLAI